MKKIAICTLVLCAAVVGCKNDVALENGPKQETQIEVQQTVAPKSSSRTPSSSDSSVCGRVGSIEHRNGFSPNEILAQLIWEGKSAPTTAEAFSSIIGGATSARIYNDMYWSYFKTDFSVHKDMLFAAYTRGQAICFSIKTGDREYEVKIGNFIFKY